MADETCDWSQPRRTREEGYVVLHPYFQAVQEAYLEAGLKRVGRTRLEIDPAAHDSPRHFAQASHDGRRIVCAPQLADMLPGDVNEPESPDEQTVVAILAHEFGHAADFCYPARFVLADGELKDLGPVDVAPEEERLARMQQWSRRDDDTVELTADAIGSLILRRKILYSGPCMLQGFSGEPRPPGLP